MILNSKLIQTLKEIPDTITSGKQVQHIKGIGKSSALKIDEILKTGRLKKAHITTEYEKVVTVFRSIYGNQHDLIHSR